MSRCLRRQMCQVRQQSARLQKNALSQISTYLIYSHKVLCADKEVQLYIEILLDTCQNMTETQLRHWDQLMTPPFCKTFCCDWSSESLQLILLWILSVVSVMPFCFFCANLQRFSWNQPEISGNFLSIMTFSITEKKRIYQYYSQSVWFTPLQWVQFNS